MSINKLKCINSLNNRIEKERTPIRHKWISPNGKYEIFGIIFPTDIIASVHVKIKGRKHPYNFYRFKDKFPKYIKEECEKIKFYLEKEVK